MSMKCDKCNEDVTPSQDDEIRNYFILKIQGRNICLCIDCESAISEWLTSEASTKHCLEFKKQFERN